MQRTIYRGVRFAPKGGGGVMAFVVSVWAAVDGPGFKEYISRVDVSRTGALVAVIISCWVALLWLTRNWNITDRQRYVARLQWYLVAHSTGYQRVMCATTDAELDAEVPRWTATMRKTIAWLALNMGAAAAAHYASGIPSGISLSWDGEHSNEHKNRRNGMLANIAFRMARLNELLASDSWDDPVPLYKRKRSKEWKQQFAQIRAEIGDDVARTL